MPADILIVGQGLAGTLLGWAFERAGIDFVIVDQGHEGAASAVAAGLITPITGRRIVKSWRIDTLLPLARLAYREIEDVLGVSLWREMRVRRLFVDERERTAFIAKTTRGELGPFAGEGDESGFWIQGAARVDLRALLDRSRRRWLADGKLRTGTVSVAEEMPRWGRVIDCGGRAAAGSVGFDFLPWEFSRGELLEIAIEGLAPDVVLNRRQWLVPVAPGVAWVGATHQPGASELVPSRAGREQLEASVRELVGVGRAFAVTDHRVGVRVNLPDKRPVAGPHPTQPRLGLINGLGGKGALWAPMLATQWVRHLNEGAAFDGEVSVNRFAK